MKRIIISGFVTIALLLSLSTVSSGQSSDFKLGGGLVLSTGSAPTGTLDNTFGFRADGVYSIDEQWRAAADFTFYLPDEQGPTKLTVWEINFNAHYLINQQNDLTVYGLGGLNITSVNFSPGISPGSEFGLNLGAGLEYTLSFANLFGEAKFGGIGADADQFVFGTGLRFAL
jgi:opacity protein-like surface antigen